MKNIFKITYSFFVILLLFGCNDKPKQGSAIDGINTKKVVEVDILKDNQMDSHNSMTALDWGGVYQGIIPCADCEGIKISITLFRDNKYRRTIEYLGKSEKAIHDSGEFIWNNEGSKITIGEGETRQSYKVAENILFHLDKAGNQIEGDLAANYKLMKNFSDANLENKKWVLTELIGKEIKESKEGKVAFVIFESKEARMSGNNSCNLFSGGYSLKPGGRIEVGQMMNTLMACDNMDVATQFMGVLQKADNYTVVDGVLHLNKARMAPLAKFNLDKNE